MPEAEEALFAIGSWVEQRNTPGSGYRFINRFIDKINSFAIPNVTYAVCKNNRLAALHLHCIAVDKWVIAFKIEKNTFAVHYIIHGSGLR